MQSQTSTNTSSNRTLPKRNPLDRVYLNITDYNDDEPSAATLLCNMANDVIKHFNETVWKAKHSNSILQQ